MAAAPPLVRGLPLLRLRLRHHHPVVGLFALLRRPLCSSTRSDEAPRVGELLRVKEPEPPKLFDRIQVSAYRKWRDKEVQILRDIEPVTLFVKQILHSDRYMDGERLGAEDEKFVIEKLLAHHPHSNDKIGCGLDSIMHC